MPCVLTRGIELHLVRPIPKNTDLVVYGLILTKILLNRIVCDWVVSCKTKGYWRITKLVPNWQRWDTREYFTDKRRLCWKQEYLDRKQESGKDTKEYYIDKMRIWIQAYSSGKRSLVEFKDEMLMGLYDAELTETCLFLCLRSCSIKTRWRQY